MTRDREDQALREALGSHSICKAQGALRKSHVMEAFSTHVDGRSFHRWYLSLYKFATEKPFVYFDDETVCEALAFFNRYPDLAIEALTDLQTELSHAVFSLLRPGTSWTRDGRLSLEHPDQMAEFERVWHPEYQRYCEHAFNHLVQLPLHILGSTKSKDYLQPKLPIRVGLLRDNGLEALTRGYDSVVRNAISHGSTSFKLTGVQYRDRTKPPRLLTPHEYASLLDGLVDTCHAILVALLLFLCENRSLVEDNRLRQLPLGLRFMLIDAIVSHASFELLSIMESDAAGKGDQLNIVSKINSRARWVHMYEGMHTCWNASLLGGDEYSRFFISFDCGMPVLPALLLDGARLQQAIQRDESVSVCVPEIIETALLWYDASTVASKMYSWKSLLPIQWETTKREIVAKWRSAGLKVLSSRYTILDVQNKSNDSVRQVVAHLLLRETGTVTGELLQDIIRHAVKKLRRRRVRKISFRGERGWPGKPDCVTMRLYARQRRIRTLLSYGYKDEELVLIAEWLSPNTSVRPFYTRQPDVVLGDIRIKHNPQLVTGLPT